MLHSVTLNNLSRSDGSALLATGETVLQASVFGPSEIKISKEMYDKAVVEVSYKPKVGQSDCNERLMEYFIRTAVESSIITSLHPRTSINIIIQEIQNAGNMLACGVNSSCLSLLDANIPMNGMIAAVCIGIFQDKIIPFPSPSEAKNAKCLTTICFKHPEEEIVNIKSSTFLDEDNFKKCLEIAKESAKDIFSFYRESLQKRYNKTS